MSFKKV
jgi:solute carrier family 44 (choline transporter-like protein), member 2/4/5